MNLQKFFSIPLVKFSVHVVLIIGFAINIFQFYRIWQTNGEINRNNIAIEKVSDLDTQESYLNSDLYKEKFSKERNFKNKGEVVVDTSTVEEAADPATLSKSQYIDTSGQDELTNVEKWWQCFVGQDRDKCISS